MWDEYERTIDHTRSLRQPLGDNDLSNSIFYESGFTKKGSSLLREKKTIKKSRAHATPF